jgi:hypothetical protein
MKPKKIATKINGIIESIAFERLQSNEINNKNDNLKTFLIGTSTGKIYEMNIDITGKEKLCQLVHSFDSSISITSIYFEIFTPLTFGSNNNYSDYNVDRMTLANDRMSEFANLNSSVQSNTQIFLMCTTSSPTRIYNYFGTQSFTAMFADYKQNGIT